MDSGPEIVVVTFGDGKTIRICRVGGILTRILVRPTLTPRPLK